MRYADGQYETSTVRPKLTNLLIMNAEFQTHERIREMLKPKRDVGLEAGPPSTRGHPLVLLAVPASFDWSLAFMDPATLTHGLRELTSPLSE
jgi:hypothetical protein